MDDAAAEARRTVLGRPGFGRYYAARSISVAGSAMTAVALPVLMFQLTGSALATAAVTALEALPYLLLGLWAGALADRWSRRRLMVMADLVSALAMATIPIAALGGWLGPGHVLVAAFVVTTAFVWFDAASWGALPALVGTKGIPAANSLLFPTEITLSIVAPGIAGLIIAVLEPAAVLAVDAVSFLLSAALLLSIRASFGGQSRREASGPGLSSEIREGLNYLWHHQTIRALVLLGFGLSFASGAVLGLLVVFASDQLGVPVGGGAVGLLFSAGAVGAAAATAAYPWFIRTLGPGRLTIWGITLVGAATLALTLSPALAVAIGVFVIWDAAFTLTVTNGITLRQQLTPDALQSRVNTTGRMIAWGGSPFGAMTAGIVAQLFDVRVAMLGAVFVLIATAALAWWSPLRSLRTMTDVVGVNE